jgi:hypothetical protein
MASVPRRLELPGSLVMVPFVGRQRASSTRPVVELDIEIVCAQAAGTAYRRIRFELDDCAQNICRVELVGDGDRYRGGGCQTQVIERIDHINGQQLLRLKRFTDGQPITLLPVRTPLTESMATNPPEKNIHAIVPHFRILTFLRVEAKRVFVSLTKYSAGRLPPPPEPLQAFAVKFSQMLTLNEEGPCISPKNLPRLPLIASETALHPRHPTSPENSFFPGIAGKGHRGSDSPTAAFDSFAEAN